MTTQAVACISTSALQHNLNVVRQHAPDAKVLAVVKANGYGHGVDTVVRTLADADAFAVGTIDEAEQLDCITDKPVVILQGVQDKKSLELCFKHNYGVVVHSEHQLALLEAATNDKRIDAWLKVDTGMHRLGFAEQGCQQAYSRLSSLSTVQSVTLLSHLACADEPGRAENQQQLSRFGELAETFGGDKSLCNSAGLISFSEHHYDWVRPGIMLYGISPLSGQSAEALNLKPVMTLKSQIIAINDCQAGDKIGYGSAYVCKKPMKVAVVGFGYGDGYPRHVPTGTPVLIQGKRVPIVGRISMDMITVDASEVGDLSIGQEVILWGEGLPIEEIAEAAGTIGYELVCRLTSRVTHQEVG